MGAGASGALLWVRTCQSVQEATCGLLYLQGTKKQNKRKPTEGRKLVFY
jgi:hypothetical protein